MTRNKKLLYPLLLVIVVFMGSSCGSIPEENPPIATGDYGAVAKRLEPMIEKQMKAHHVVGLSIVLVDDQMTVWSKGFGYADLSKEVPATGDTIYRVGSISKPITAVAVEQLVDQGLLDLDKLFASYIPEFSVRSRFAGSQAITARNLMTHHAGVPEVERFDTLRELITDLKGEYANFPPNMVYSYTNTGFSLLGRLIEVLSGKEFSEYMDEAVLRPIGMLDSSYILRDRQKVNLSKGYTGGNERVTTPIPHVPAGAAYSSASDLGRFLQMIFNDGVVGNRRILSSAGVAELLRPQNEDIPLDLDLRVGLDWVLTEMDIADGDKVRIAIHGGATPLFHAQVRFSQDAKIGVVVLINSAEGGGIIESLANEAMNLMYEAKTGESARSAAPPKPAPRAALTTDELAVYEGYYDTAEGFMHVVKRRDTLVTDLFGKKVQFIPRTDGTFTTKFLLFGFIPLPLKQLENSSIFIERIDGHNVIVDTIGGVRSRRGSKIDPYEISETWKNRIGIYEIEESRESEMYFETVGISEDSGFLFVDLVRQVPSLDTKPFWRFVLAPADDSNLYFAGLGNDRGHTLSFESRGDVLHMWGMTFRLRQD